MTRVLRMTGFVAGLVVFAAIGYLLVRHYGGEVSADLRDPPPVNAHEIDIAIADLAGEPRRLDTWRDGPMLINFWATWCPPCRKEIPMLIDLQDQYREQGLSVVGVAIEETEPVKAFADEMAFNYPILVGEASGVELATALGADIMALPITVFVDRDGNVTRHHLGELHLDDAETAIAEIIAR